MRSRTLILLFSHLLFLGWSLISPKISLSQEKPGEGVPVTGGIYRKPLEFTPRTLDPALATDIYSVTVIQQLFDGLVQFDKDLNVIPALAKSWKISPDGLTYTFSLKEGVRFHNGREVTAKDFVYSFTRIIDPETRSSSSDFFGRIVGAKELTERKTKEIKGLIALDKYTLVIMLSEPYAPFISILAMKGAKVISREDVEKGGIDFGKPPMGTGPFKLKSIRIGEEIVLEANSDYFEGRPYLDKIIFKIFHGAPREKMFKEFKNEDLEESFIPPEELEEVIRERRFLFFQKPILSLRFYGFHVSAKPLDDKKLRKAINYAIDKKSIISQIHKDQFSLAKAILPPGMPGYDPTKNYYPWDEAKAVRLLAEAGYGKSGAVQPLEIWSATRSEAAQKELNEIKSQLQRIGISVSIHFDTDWPSFESMLRSNRAPVFLYAWYADFPDPDNFLGTLFHSKSKYNYTGYHHSEVDFLLDKARTERDYLRRMEMYRKVEDIVLKDAPIVPMVNPLLQLVYQPYVRGIELSALGAPYIPMKKIWLRKGR